MTARQDDQEWLESERSARLLAARRAQRECEAAVLDEDDGLPGDGPPWWAWLLGAVIAGAALLWVLRP